MLGTKAFLISGIVSYVPKCILGRSRPDEYKTVDAFDFNPLSGSDSFYSGHTVVVFATATVLATEYSNYTIVPISAYSLATIIGFSRVYDNRHWASDVFMGAFVGWAIGKLICNKNNWGIELNPIYENGIGGIGLNIPLGTRNVKFSTAKAEIIE